MKRVGMTLSTINVSLQALTSFSFLRLTPWDPGFPDEHPPRAPHGDKILSVPQTLLGYQS